MSDSKPYRSGPPLRTGDRIAFVCGDRRIEGTARVEGDAREQSITIIPDGEPMLYGRDYTLGDRHVCDDTCSVGPFAPVPDWLPEKPSNVDLIETDIPAIGDDLTFTAHRWLKGDPIPYDEMRRLCGLTDVSAYIAKRDAELKVREQYAAQSLIHMLTRATDKIPVYRGPNQFPSYQDLRGPTQWIRHQVLRDALGTGEPFDEAAAVALRKDLTDEQRAVVLEQCAFIREHTDPRKPWLSWANPFLPPELSRFAKTKQERAYSPHGVQVDVGGRTPQWMIGVGLVEPEPETPQQRALPRPSTTPPPWADNPAGQRRPARTRNHRRVK